MAEEIQAVQLRPETLAAFEAYIREAEAAMDETLEGPRFLWCDAEAKRSEQVRQGKIIAEFCAGKGPAKVPSGLIHDWVGAAFAPGGTVAGLLAVIQNYDNHKNTYRPEVIESKLLNRNGSHFQIYLRVLKKKIITVVIDSEHDVHYYVVDPLRQGCRSRTTRTSEVDDAGTPRERVKAPDTGYGFLWRLNSYWRFLERDGGVYMECRAVSLTRDIPTVFRLIVGPMVRSLPRDALIHTLRATREAVVAGQ